MRLRWNLVFRKFNNYDERRDSGYYTDLSDKRYAKIDVNTSDNAFEQILTVYHEVTHAVFDLLTQYKFEKKKKRYSKRDGTIRKDWKKLDNSNGREEQICIKVEAAVARVLRKEIPKEYWHLFFKKD